MEDRIKDGTGDTVLKFFILIVLMAMAWIGLSSMERRTLYYPDRQVFATPAAYGLAFENVNLKTSDGAEIKGWFVPADRSASTLTLLFCHGNAGNISHRLEKLQKFHHMGLNVLLFDYRGYGQSQGTPSEAGTYADAEAVYEYLTQIKGIPPGRIVLYGESLGCAVATEMARRHAAAALILESPFTSTVAMAKLIFPRLPVYRIVRYRYDNLTKIPGITMPLLIMHSPQDDIVPFEMGRQLYAAAPEPKRFFELTGDHNEGYELTGDRYISAITQFLKSLSL